MSVLSLTACACACGHVCVTRAVRWSAESCSAICRTALPGNAETAVVLRREGRPAVCWRHGSRVRCKGERRLLEQPFRFATWGCTTPSPPARGRRLSQISIVGHYAYQIKSFSMGPWPINSFTSRGMRARGPGRSARAKAGGRQSCASCPRLRSQLRPNASQAHARTLPSP